MAVTPTVAVAKVVAPAVEATLKAISPGLLTKVGNLTKAAYDRIVVQLGLGLSDYLNTSYESSRFFKTILNPTVPLSVLDNYINIDLAVSQIDIPDTTFLSNIETYQRVVITGLAGGGKSMLMKYLTLLQFEYPTGRIPLFTVLRNLNSLTDKNLTAFIRASCVQKGAELTTEQFDLALKAGVFVLLLDGFDEIDIADQDSIQRQILSIQKDYPKCIVIVSSRPDDRFSGWQSYYIIGVKPLNKTQCLKLIDSLPYDQGVKRRFRKEVDTKLFESHGSFLSSPLLTTIMLLTYEAFAEIPDRMHSFYGQAFDTLYQKHDAQKEQFQRKTHTELSLEEFKQCFAAFCAMSYLSESFSFDNDELIRTANNAVRYFRSANSGLGTDLTGEQLIADLKASVCMIQPDGLRQIFVHRLFQEYFSALFAVSLHSSRIGRILDRFAMRYGDHALPMALDMARETVEQEWVLPTINQLTVVLERREGETLGNVIARLMPNAYMSVASEMFYIAEINPSDNASKLSVLHDLYPEHFSNNDIWGRTIIFDKQQMADLLSNEKSRRKHKTALVKLLTQRSSIIGISPDDGHDWWLDKIGFNKELEKTLDSLKSVAREINGREYKKKVILDEFI